ncbi:hypothetical protein [Amycolatopsis sp. cmx-11-51]|uniref:hypothetical protein n=1 Tax=unclassified Amycolatopsis TaxID=2618356 RepID=UPI0039E4FB88
MTSHVFVDESKEGGYLVTAAALLSGDLTSARRAMRSLVLPRQRRLHFTHENDGRRKLILDTIAELGPQVKIYDASAHHRRRQREVCLAVLVEDLAAAGTRMLVLETDESIVDLDRKTLYRSVRRLVAETFSNTGTYGRSKNRCSPSQTRWPGVGNVVAIGNAAPSK